MATFRSKLDEVKEDIKSLIDPKVVERACHDAGHSWRDRALDPLTTLRAFGLQIAHGNCAMAHLVRLFGGAFTESAYCQARARLPIGVVAAVLEDYTSRTSGVANDGLWNGHRVVIADGSGLSTPDTPELRAAFGTTGPPRPGCNLPMVHALLAIRASDGLLLSMHASPAASSDLRYVHELHPALHAGDVLVGDRGFCAYTHLATLLKRGCHGVFRMASSRKMPFPAQSGERPRRRHDRQGHSQPMLIQRISNDDQVVEIVKPINRSKHMPPEVFAKIPSKLIVRALRFTVQGPGKRSREIVILTTLIDAKKYPAAAIAELYLVRWRIETNIRHLKRTMGMDRLKCQTVEGVTRELMMFALVYNAICNVRSCAAKAMNIAPTRVSFIDTLRAIIIAAAHAISATQRTPDLKVWPLRPPRIHPRMLKREHSQFRVMKRPRPDIISWIVSLAINLN